MEKNGPKARKASRDEPEGAKGSEPKGDAERRPTSRKRAKETSSQGWRKVRA